MSPRHRIPQGLIGGVAAMAVASIVAACSADGPTAVGETGVWSAGTAAHAIVVGSMSRSFLVHVPSRRRLSSSSLPLPWPLVIVLHGSGGNGSSDALRFLVAYPDATGGAFGLYPPDWNAGSCCGAAYRDNIDDLGFISGLVRDVAAHVPVDSRRVYVAGFSAGGRMAYHVGCQLAPLVAAIAVVSGSLVDNGCTPANPVPLFAVHGTDDSEVPFGQDAPSPSGMVPAIADSLPPSVQFWTSMNGCTAGSVLTLSPHVLETSLTPCSSGDVNFYAIDGGTHGWPGGPVDPGAQPPMNELNASVAMWRFFIRHLR
jgi:polyhydroxybutyrate depolymerase